MPDDARVSVNICGRAVKPAELHEPCGMDRSVSSTFTLQSPATPAGSATTPVWVATQVSDMFVSTICGGPEVVGVVESVTLATVRTSTLPSGPMHLCWAGEQPAMAGQPRDAGVRDGGCWERA